MSNSIDNLLLNNPTLADVGAPCSDQDIDNAIKVLALELPASFRYYLKKWGWISFGPNVYFGLGSTTQDFVTITLRIRKIRDLPIHLVVVCDHEGDEYICLDTSRMKDGECPVVVWDSPSQIVSRSRANNFIEFLESDIKEFL
jgi:antitoxin YobK